MIIAGQIKEIDYSEGYALAVGDCYLAEALEIFHGKLVNALWVISDTPININDVLIHQVNLTLGVVDAELVSVYSDITGFLWVDEEGKIGGHDLIDIFSMHLYEYGYLIISEEPIDLTTLGKQDD